MFRKKQQEPDEVDPDSFVDDLDEEDRAYEDRLLLEELAAKEALETSPLVARPQGPWDLADAPTEVETARIDLGGLLVPVPADTEVRVDVSPEGEVVAATLVRGESALQVNAFAAPKRSGIWSEVREEIATALTGSGGAAEVADGPFGPELRASVPTEVPGQGVVMAPARFLGVDGPRWFLRALVTGPAATDPVAAADLEAALRQVVVVRGDAAMAVRDALPLHLPKDVQEQVTEDQGLELPVRGPEITEIR